MQKLKRLGQSAWRAIGDPRLLLIVGAFEVSKSMYGHQSGATAVAMFILGCWCVRVGWVGLK